MKLAAAALVCALAGCSAHTQVHYGAGSFSGSGTSVTTSSGGISVQGSGSAAAALIGLGIVASVMQAQNDGVRHHANPFSMFSQSEPVAAPELAPVRKVNEQDCTRPIQDWSANLKCR